MAGMKIVVVLARTLYQPQRHHPLRLPRDVRAKHVIPRGADLLGGVEARAVVPLEFRVLADDGPERLEYLAYGLMELTSPGFGPTAS